MVFLEEPLCWQVEGRRTCCCGCGETVRKCFVSSHDGRVMGWLTRIEKGEMTVDELPREVWRINLNRFYNGAFADLDLGPGGDDPAAGKDDWPPPPDEPPFDLGPEWEPDPWSPSPANTPARTVD